MYGLCVKQKNAYELRISDWRSDVCSSDLPDARLVLDIGLVRRARGPTVRHALARIGEKQGLLRQLVLVLDANLEIADMLRLAGERRAVAEEVRRGKNAAIGENDIEIGRAACRERVCQYV